MNNENYYCINEINNHPVRTAIAIAEQNALDLFVYVLTKKQFGTKTESFYWSMSKLHESCAGSWVVSSI